MLLGNRSSNSGTLHHLTINVTEIYFKAYNTYSILGWDMTGKCMHHFDVTIFLPVQFMKPCKPVDTSKKQTTFQSHLSLQNMDEWRAPIWNISSLFNGMRLKKVKSNMSSTYDGYYVRVSWVSYLPICSKNSAISDHICKANIIQFDTIYISANIKICLKDVGIKGICPLHPHGHLSALSYDKLMWWDKLFSDVMWCLSVCG